ARRRDGAVLPLGGRRRGGAGRGACFAARFGRRARGAGAVHVRRARGPPARSVPVAALTPLSYRAGGFLGRRPATVAGSPRFLERLPSDLRKLSDPLPRLGSCR